MSDDRRRAGIKRDNDAAHGILITHVASRQETDIATEALPHGARHVAGTAAGTPREKAIWCGACCGAHSGLGLAAVNQKAETTRREYIWLPKRDSRLGPSG